MTRKLKKVESETQTHNDLSYVEKHWNGGKGEMHNVGPDYGEKTENVENEWKTL